MTSTSSPMRSPGARHLSAGRRIFPQMVSGEDADGFRPRNCRAQRRPPLPDHGGNGQCPECLGKRAALTAPANRSARYSLLGLRTTGHNDRRLDRKATDNPQHSSPWRSACHSVSQHAGVHPQVSTRPLPVGRGACRKVQKKFSSLKAEAGPSQSRCPGPADQGPAPWLSGRRQRGHGPFAPR